MRYVDPGVISHKICNPFDTGYWACISSLQIWYNWFTHSVNQSNQQGRSCFIELGSLWCIWGPNVKVNPTIPHICHFFSTYPIFYNFFSTQKRVNRVKTDLTKQRKTDFMTKNWINFRFLHIFPVERCEISPNLAKIHISPHLLCVGIYKHSRFFLYGLCCVDHGDISIFPDLYFRQMNSSQIIFISLHNMFRH